VKRGIRKLVILLDVDNVLMPYTETACQKAARGNQIDVKDVATDFYDDQVPYPGAVEMIEELQEAGHDVVIGLAMKPHQMGIRANQILTFFPSIDPNNIVLGSRKDLIHADFLLDDAMYNITSSRAEYPVVFNRPWNMSAEGYLRVSSYEEFINLVEAVSLAPAVETPRLNIAGRPGMICLVGPSASGKSSISDELVKNPLFRRIRSLTTRAPRPNSNDLSEYKFVTEEQFLQAIDAGVLVEHAVYAGYRYGTSKEEIQSIWADGRIAISPVDINGAMACKSAYGDRCVTVFIRRNKEDIISALLERDVPTEDKVRRLMSLDKEMENEQICDWTISNNGSLEHAIQQILQIVR